MPKFLEAALRKEYGDNSHAIYGTMNRLGAMHGNKETAKGRAMERKHEAKVAKSKPAPKKPAGESHSYNFRERHGKARVKTKFEG